MGRADGRVGPMSAVESIDLVALPKFWEDHKKVLIEIPIRVVAIIVVALIIRAVLRRMIDRAVRPVRGEVPRLLRPFKEKLANSSILESSGLLSERRAQRAETLGSVLKSAVGESGCTQTRSGCKRRSGHRARAESRSRSNSLTYVP